MRRRSEPVSAKLRSAAAAACLGAVLWTGCGAPQRHGVEPESPPAGGDFEARFQWARTRLLDAIEDGATPDAGTRQTFRELASERLDDARVVAYLGSIRLLDARSASARSSIRLTIWFTRTPAAGSNS